MGTVRIVFGGLLAFLAACGGSVDTTTTSDPATLPQRPAEQGTYVPPAASGPEHVADGLGAPSAIAMTSDSVLFTTRSTMLGGELVAAGGLFAASKQAGAPQMLAVDHQGATYEALVTDGTTAFIATSDARILGVAAVGGVPKVLATLQANAVAITTNGDYVYVATDAGALARVSKTGGPVETLATITGAVRGLQADDAAVYVATGAGEETAAGIVRVALDGKVTTLASSAEPCAMIRDGRSLYWTNVAAATTSAQGKGEILRLALDGAAAAATVASGSFSACAIAADHDSLYFATTLPNALPVKANGGSGSKAMSGLGLMRAPIAGGEPVAIAQASRALAQPGAVAVDATHLYWLTETAVLRLHK